MTHITLSSTRLGFTLALSFGGRLTQEFKKPNDALTVINEILKREDVELTPEAARALGLNQTSFQKGDSCDPRH